MKFTFKKDADPVVSSELYYDLFDGGYIDPASLLDKEEEIEKVKDAINLIEDFLRQAEDKGLVGVI